MNAPFIICSTCGRSWPLPVVPSLYAELLLEAQPCPACEAYTLSCPDPEAEGPDSEAEDAGLLLCPRGHGSPAGLRSWPRRSPTAPDGR